MKKIETKKVTLYLSYGRLKLSASELKSLEGPFLELVKVFETFFYTKGTSPTLSYQSIKKLEFCLELCGNAKIQGLNAHYRSKNKVTDVLSFPIFDDLRRRKLAAYETSGGIINLGDIIICHDMAKRQAKNFNIAYWEEVIHLTLHGLLHLCGFDHEASRKEEEMMSACEEKLLIKIYKRLGLKWKNN